MPITNSAKKALRQNARRRKGNLLKKEAYKKSVKTFHKLIAEKKTEEAKKYLSLVYQSLDKAVKTGVLKKNKSSRLKSRLAKFSRKNEVK